MPFGSGVTEVKTLLKPGQSISIGKKYNANTPPFDCIGGNMMHTKVERYENLYLVLADLSSPANWFWWNLINERNTDNNVTIFKAKDMNESKKITKAYKELHDKDLVKRVKRQYYLINPMAIIPLKTYDQVLTHWHSL